MIKLVQYGVSNTLWTVCLFATAAMLVPSTAIVFAIAVKIIWNASETRIPQDPNIATLTEGLVSPLSLYAMIGGLVVVYMMALVARAFDPDYNKGGRS